MPVPTIIHCNGKMSESGPKTTIPTGRNPEYIAPINPNTRPCMDSSAFSCIIVVVDVCTIVNAMLYKSMITR